MNEFPDSGHQPTDNPRRQARWSDTPTFREPAKPARPAAAPRREPVQPAAPANPRRPAAPRRKPAQPPAPPPPADPPVQVRIVWDAGIPPPVARELEQAERDLFRSRVSPDPGARKVRDFTLSAGDGFLVDIPGRPQIAVGKIADAIYMLLGGASRWVDRVPPVVPARPGLPDTPVRVRIVWDAGITFPVVRELGQAEWDLFRARVRPDPGARKVPDVRRVNFTLSAGDGFVVDSPALPRIAVGKIADAINLLLVRACRAPFLPAELSPLHEPKFGPITRVRP